MTYALFLARKGGDVYGSIYFKTIGDFGCSRILVSVISFTLVHMLPGDPAVLALGSEASEQDIATFREKYYLNRPVVEQYFIWISDTLRGDLGASITYSRPVLTCLKGCPVQSL